MEAKGKEIESIDDADAKWKEGFKSLLRVERRNASTPPPAWRHSLHSPVHKIDSSISARKLCTKLWELEPLSQSSSISTKKINADDTRRFVSRFAEPSSSTKTYLNQEYSHSLNEVGTNKISVELLKVLTKILSLEEHPSSNSLLVKALKAKLENHPRSKRGEMKRSKPKHTVYKEDKDPFECEYQNLIFSWENQRERGRKGSNILESLCDEFSKEILRYEQEVRRLRKKGESTSKKPILHVAEAWIDGRTQMGRAKAKAERDVICSKLSHDIEGFLQGSSLCSIRESFPLDSASSTFGNESSSDCDCFGPPTDLHSLEASYKNYFPSLKMNPPNNTSSSPGDKMYPDSEMPPDKNYTLRAKLLEARLDDYKARTKP